MATITGCAPGDFGRYRSPASLTPCAWRTRVICAFRSPARARLKRRREAASQSNACDLLGLLPTEHEEFEQGLLRMQAVLRLVPDHALRAVDHLGGDFLTAVRG